MTGKEAAKAVLSGMALAIGLFIQLPLMFMMGLLLYQHVEATSVMWLLWGGTWALMVLQWVFKGLAWVIGEA